MGLDRYGTQILEGERRGKHRYVRISTCAPCSSIKQGKIRFSTHLLYYVYCLPLIPKKYHNITFVLSKGSRAKLCLSLIDFIFVLSWSHLFISFLFCNRLIQYCSCNCLLLLLLLLLFLIIYYSLLL